MTQAELLKVIQQANFDEIEEARLYALVELNGVNFETVAEVTLAVQARIEELQEKEAILTKLNEVAQTNKTNNDAILDEIKQKLNVILEDLAKGPSAEPPDAPVTSEPTLEEPPATEDDQIPADKTETDEVIDMVAEQAKAQTQPPAVADNIDSVDSATSK